MHSFARCAFAPQNAMFFPRRAPRRAGGASRDSLRSASVACGASWDFLRCAPVVPRRPTGASWDRGAQVTLSIFERPGRKSCMLEIAFHRERRSVVRTAT
jgi:hypothetical protein